MPTPFVCFRCARRLTAQARHFSAFPPQAGKPAAYVTLSNILPPKPHPRPHQLSRPARTSPRDRKKRSHGLRKIDRDGRDRSLEDLFASSARSSKLITDEQQRLPTEPSEGPAPPQSPIPKSPEAFDVFKRLGQCRNLPLRDCWSATGWTDEGTGPPNQGGRSVWADSVKLDLSRGDRVITLLRTTFNSYINDGPVAGVPSPTAAIRAMDQAGLLLDRTWVGIMWPLVNHIYDLDEIDPRLRDTSESASSAASMLVEVVDVLTLAARALRPGDSKVEASSYLEAATNWPSVEEIEHVKGDLPKTYNQRFRHFFPISSESPDISLTALTLFDLLTSPMYATRAKHRPSQAQPFILFMAHMVVGAEPSRPRVWHVHPLRIAVAHAMYRKWDDLVAKAMALAMVEESPMDKPAAQLKEASLGDIHSQLQFAVDHKQASAVEALWQRAQARFAISNDPDSPAEDSTPVLRRSKKRRISREFYNQFLFSFMAVREPEIAVTVWQHMLASGIAPSLASWHAMLKGALRAKHRLSLEIIWRRMLASGMAPDAHCWTTRIQGLIKCGEVEGGLRALDEMGRAWRLAVKQVIKQKGIEIVQKDLASLGAVNGVPKPTIVTVNATILALVESRMSDTADTVLEWAAAIGLRPDVFTYNAFLRRAVIRDQHEECVRLLEEMDREGVAPDIATFTILLDGVSRSSSFGGLVGRSTTTPADPPAKEAAAVEARKVHSSTRDSTTAEPPVQSSRDESSASTSSKDDAPLVDPPPLPSSSDDPSSEKSVAVKPSPTSISSSTTPSSTPKPPRSTLGLTPPTILNLLSTLESHGLRPTPRSYSTLILHLLHQHNSLAGAKAVLDHMAGRGLKPSHHVYTMLVTHYFADRPGAGPDLRGLEALWMRIQLEAGVVDVVFYDRLIEGYCRVAETARLSPVTLPPPPPPPPSPYSSSLSPSPSSSSTPPQQTTLTTYATSKSLYFLDHMLRDGKRPGWTALNALVRNLWYEGLVGEVERLVGELLGGRGAWKRRSVGGGRVGEEAFWRLVQELRGRGLRIGYVGDGKGEGEEEEEEEGKGGERVNGVGG
ncbi:MAG: hypothetical protein M1817_001119 [Caeruleum heppii]|nr:MAG: hypothetical protein M1817_001119 [Caeruleum heppii]